MGPFGRWTLLISALAIALATGCSKREAPAQAVVAKVNGEPVTLQRFRSIVARAGQHGAQAEPADILEKVIDRQLLAQKAVKAGLSRKASVDFAVEDFREQLLAQAYVEEKLGASPVHPNEVRRYYDEHPSLFRERRIWRVFELSLTAAPQTVAELKHRAYRANGLHELADWLKHRGIAFNVAGSTLPSERAPSAMLSTLERMREGQIAVIEMPRGASVIQLVHAQPSPLSIQEASPGIEQSLRARKRAEIHEAETRQLRSVAAVEYVLDFGRKDHPDP